MASCSIQTRVPDADAVEEEAWRGDVPATATATTELLGVEGRDSDSDDNDDDSTTMMMMMIG